LAGLASFAENVGGFDVVLDLNGGPYFAASLEAMALRGRLILIGGVAGGKTNVDLYQILRKRLHIIGTVMRARSLPEKIANTTAFAQEVVPLFANGTIEPVVDSAFPLEQIQQAHRRLESNETFGKVVLTIS
jgi:NADPH:quinone reductase-like Zn-dependent oxidoreductase